MLFKELMESSAVEVTCSGTSHVETVSGLGEDGMLGPLEYPLIPAVLSDSLANAKTGVGVAAEEGVLASLEGKDPLAEEDTHFFEEADARAPWRMPILL